MSLNPPWKRLPCLAQIHTPCFQIILQFPRLHKYSVYKVMRNEALGRGVCVHKLKRMENTKWHSCVLPSPTPPPLLVSWKPCSYNMLHVYMNLLNTKEKDERHQNPVRTLSKVRLWHFKPMQGNCKRTKWEVCVCVLDEWQT